MHRINLAFFASEPSGGASLLLSCPASEKLASAGVRAQQWWSRSHGREDGSREDSHTRSVRWPAPLRGSALKEQFLCITRVIAFF